MPLHEQLRKIQLEWALSDEQMASILHVSRETYEGWVSGAAANDGATIPQGMETAVPFLNIHRRLSRKLPETEKQAEWLLKGHPDFDGNKPIDVAASSPENLLWLSYYLESSLG